MARVRVLVTGGAGFIGSNLVRRLIADSHNVVVVDNMSTGRVENLSGLEIELITDSVLNADLMKTVVSSVDSVVHLAALGSVIRSVNEPLQTHETNVGGMLAVLEAARVNMTPLTVISSSSVYGKNLELPKLESMAIAPISPYAASKAAVEHYARSYAHCYGLPITTLRPFNVYGQWQRPDHEYAAVIPKWIGLVLKGQQIEVHGMGDQTRDFTHVDTVTEILASAIGQGLNSGAPINMAFGNRTSLKEVLRLLSEELGVSLDIRWLPTRSGDVHDSQNSPGLIRELFPHVRPISFDDGFRRTVEWYRAQISAQLT